MYRYDVRIVCNYVRAQRGAACENIQMRWTTLNGRQSKYTYMISNVWIYPLIEWICLWIESTKKVSSGSPL